MELNNLSENDLLQMQANKQNEILMDRQNIEVVEEVLFDIKKKELELEDKRLQYSHNLKQARHNLARKKVELDMIENRIWALRRGV